MTERLFPDDARVLLLSNFVNKCETQ